MNQRQIVLKSMFLIIVAILFFAVYGSVQLSINDFKLKDICPKLLGIPACYWVTIFFVIALFSHLNQKFEKAKYVFFMSIGFVFIMALNGTVTELSGTIVCPRTSGGTPMCFISLAMCTSLLILKSIELRIQKITTNI